MNIPRFVGAILLSATMLSVPTASYAAKGDGAIHSSNHPISGQYVVVLNDNTTNVPSVVNDVAGSGKVLATYKSALKGFAIKTSAKEAKRIANDPNVAYVQQDGIVKTTDDVGVNVNQFVPAPPDSFWGLNRIDQRVTPSNGSGTYTWVYSGAGVNAYVIDTGILTTHTQFSGRATFDFTASDAGNPGVDCNGHGTHVSGTIGGNTYGVAKNVRLHAVKVLNCVGSGSFSGVIQGVDFVTANAVKPAVANMSLGGGNFLPLDIAVNNSIESGVTYSVSAGNNNSDACLSSPASTLAAITVGSTGNAFNTVSPISDNRSSFSNYGPCLDVFAPGAEIRSAYIGSNTNAETLNGTSMASPHVAGVAALILQKVPTANPMAVRNYITSFSTKSTVVDPGPGSPNRLLYAGNVPTLSANASPEPITCTRNIAVSGTLVLQGVPLSGRTIEVWFDRTGSTPPAFKGTSITNAGGGYTRTVSQANDGTWFSVYRGAPLIGSKQSSGDFVDCLNRS